VGAIKENPERRVIGWADEILEKKFENLLATKRHA
jgi:hypothetical protein